MNRSEIVCLGRRYLSDKLVWLFITAEQLTMMVDKMVSPDTIEFAASAFNSCKGQRFVTGGRYETEAECDETGKLQKIRFDAPKFLGRLTDVDALVMAWEVKDKTANDTDKGKRAHERLLKEPNVNRLFAQIGAIYRRLPPADRDGFELMLIRQLRRRD
jgi:hypothetical protein